MVGVFTPEKSAKAIGIFFFNKSVTKHLAITPLLARINREEQISYLGIYQNCLAQFQINNYFSLISTHTHTHTHSLPIDYLRLNQDRKGSLSHTKSRREEKGKRILRGVGSRFIEP